MLKRFALLLVVSLFVFGLSAALAEETAAPPAAAPEVNLTTITGTVKARFDDQKALVGASINVVEDSKEKEGEKVTTYYRITLDDNGKKLATELDGKMAKVTGVLSEIEKDGKKSTYITVKEYTEVKEEKKVEEKKAE